MKQNHAKLSLLVCHYYRKKGSARMGNYKISEFESEFGKYYNMVFRYCMRLTGRNQYDAEDLTSDVFHLFYLMQNRLEFESPTALTAWLYQTARNLRMKTVRHAMRKPPDIDETDLFSNQFDGVKEEQQYQEYIGKIERILSGRDLALFRTIVIERLPYPEAAEQLGLSEQNLRTRWFRLRKKIRPTVEKILMR